MSKKLIAGAGVVASLAVALAPLATFAQSGDSMIGVDNFQITILESCSFTVTGTATDYAEANPDATPDPVEYSPFSNTYTRETNAGQLLTITGGKLVSEDATGTTPTTIKVTCNHDPALNAGTNEGHGYQIKALATDLTIYHNSVAGTEKIPANVDPQTGVSGWGAKFSRNVTKADGADGVNGDMTITGGYESGYKALPTTTAGVVASGNVSRAAGDEFVIDGYQVSTNTTQKAGVYKGNVTYTFVAPVNGTN